jgi:hypothetical protein
VGMGNGWNGSRSCPMTCFSISDVKTSDCTVCELVNIDTQVMSGFC